MTYLHARKPWAKDTKRYKMLETQAQKAIEQLSSLNGFEAPELHICDKKYLMSNQEFIDRTRFLVSHFQNTPTLDLLADDLMPKLNEIIYFRQKVGAEIRSAGASHLETDRKHDHRIEVLGVTLGFLSDFGAL